MPGNTRKMIPMPGWRARGLFAALVFAALALGGLRTPAAASERPIIAAASDLRFALQDIARAFRRESGAELRLSFGSSGNFARQIRQGAPYEIYMSADEEYVLDLAKDGFTRDAGVLYAIGRIVLFAPEGSPIAVDSGFDGLRKALADGRIKRFAIANPAHAPYGRAAKEALIHAGFWAALQPVLVLGENVSQAAQFAASGSSQGGIFAYSLVLSPSLSDRGRYALIPAAWHRPLRQRMVLLKSAGAEARRFYRYVQQPAARAVLRRYGFVLPDEG